MEKARRCLFLLKKKTDLIVFFSSGRNFGPGWNVPVKLCGTQWEGRVHKPHGNIRKTLAGVSSKCQIWAFQSQFGELFHYPERAGSDPAVEAVNLLQALPGMALQWIPDLMRHEKDPLQCPLSGGFPARAKTHLKSVLKLAVCPFPLPRGRGAKTHPARCCFCLLVVSRLGMGRSDPGLPSPISAILPFFLFPKRKKK